LSQPWHNANKKTDNLYSGNTHVMNPANLLKKFHIRFSLSRPKSHQIRLKVSKLNNTNFQLSIDPQNLCFTTV